jgi:streptogramin lyase
VSVRSRKFCLRRALSAGDRIPVERPVLRRWLLRCGAAALAVVPVLVVAVPANGAGASVPDYSVTNFTDPSISGPTSITVGSDGALWFVNTDRIGPRSIGRISTEGIVSSFAGPGISSPKSITAGPDGNLWFTDDQFIRAGNHDGWIGRITPAGVVTTFTSPNIYYPQGIVAGSDGALWFINRGDSDTIGRITTSGVVTAYSGFESMSSITSGPDGSLWFVSDGPDGVNSKGSIGRMSTAGVVTQFNDPTIDYPVDITSGPDGALWFTNSNGSIGRITVGGKVTNYPGGGSYGITTGPDGALWFGGGTRIGRITPAGVISNHTGAGIDIPRGITSGPDGALWFTNFANNSIGRITPGPTLPAVTGVSPNSGPSAGGTEVTLTGVGFTGATKVAFGTVAVPFTFVSDTEITAVAPAQPPGSRNLYVTTPAGTSGPAHADLFDYLGPKPVITGISPAVGPSRGGTAVTITGTGFTGATKVAVGGEDGALRAGATFTVDSDSQITAVSPPATSGNLPRYFFVSTTGGVSTAVAADQFTYQEDPTLFSPASGPTAGGTVVTITGVGLLGTTAVHFGTAAASFTVDSDTQVTAVAPAHAEVETRIVLTLAGGQTLATNQGYLYIAPRPVVTSISPDTGPTAGGTTVTITGTGFTGATLVAFGNVIKQHGPYARPTVVSDTEITVLSTRDLAGRRNVYVISRGGGSAATPGDVFTYTRP